MSMNFHLSMSLQVTLDVYWLVPTGRVVKLDVCGSRQSSVRWSTSTRSSRWRSSGGRRQRRRRWRRSLREAASTNRTGSGDSPKSFPQIPLSRRQWQDLNRWPYYYKSIILPLCQRVISLKLKLHKIEAVPISTIASGRMDSKPRS